MQAIYIIWLRELKKFWRNKSRVIGSLGMPFFMLVVVGFGLNKAMNNSALPGGNYTLFIMPGIIAMVILFGSVFSGVSVIWDKQFGFMKEMLVAPLSRTTIVIGKTLGGATTAILQAFLMLTLSIILGIRPHSFYGVLLAIPIMFLISISFVALGLTLASKMTDMHGFQLIVNFLIMPMFFLSGALFPLDTAPQIIKTISLFDPLTYGVEALRFCFLGTSTISIFVCLLVLFLFSIITLSIGIYFFRNMES